VIAIDQTAKTLVLRGIAKGEVIELALGVRLVRAFNTGMSFSLGRGSGALKLTVFVLVAGLIVVARRELRRPEEDPHAPTRAGVVAFGLIIGGAVANLVDRALRGGRGFGQGAVIDFIDVGWWPVFNTADSALVIGCLTLMLWSLRGMKAGTSSAETMGHRKKDEHDDGV
jgi:signal peptidase II